jgi:mRNA interferase MazF
MVIRRGEIWWASLPAPSGSEPGYRRPLLILQSDDFNRSAIATVIGVVLTSNINLAQAPGNVILSKKQTGLPKESVANISQIITVDKDYFTERIGALKSNLLKQVEEGIRLILCL